MSQNPAALASSSPTEPSVRTTSVDDQITIINGNGTERTPLLARSEQSHFPRFPGDEAEQGPPVDERPMPYAQVLILCYASIAEPAAYFAIFPFISDMIQRNGNIPDDDIGFWAGLIESLFSAVQMILMIYYGRLADRLGRKPVLVFSLAGMSFSTALFGFSRNLWQMVLFRCIAGLFAGSVVTTRTMLSEHTTKLTQGRAFSWYMFARQVGLFIGPLIGGVLANPAAQYPGTFGDIVFFQDYPYALPTLVTGAITASGAVMCFCFVKETLDRTRPNALKSRELTVWALLQEPGVAIVLYVFAHITILALGYTAVSPVFQAAKIELGGWRLTTAQISYVIAVAGVSQAAWILFVFPPLQRRIGSGGVLKVCGVVWPFFMALSPAINEILRRGHIKLALGLGIPGLVLGSGVAMAFAANQLSINDVSPTPAVLGTVNAVSLAVNSGIRAIAPALFSSIYAVGVKLGWAHGHLIWILLVILSAAWNIPLRYLPEEVNDKLKTRLRKPDNPGPNSSDDETVIA